MRKRRKSKIRKRKSRAGKGLVNTIIDSLPFEAHVPGYNFLGPGTNLQQRINQKGINPLDDAAKEHDIAYSKSSNLKDRHIADQILANKAWDRAGAKDASFIGERVPAWFTTTFMNIKRKLGAGSRMRRKRRGPRKQRRPRKRVGSGLKKKKRRGIKLANILSKARSALSPSLPLNTNIERSLAAVNQYRKSNKGPILIKKRIIPLPKQGGFLQFIPPVLAALAAIKAAGSTVKTVADSVSAVNNARKNLMGKGLKQGGAQYLDTLYFNHPGRRGSGHRRRRRMHVKRGKNNRLNLHF